MDRRSHELEQNHLNARQPSPAILDPIETDVPVRQGSRRNAVGRDGHFKGLIGRSNFYAIRIVDKRRGKEYTPWRNKVLKRSADDRQVESQASNELSA